MEKLRATPAARSMAKKLELDLQLIQGSGANGRIHKQDVVDYKDELVPRISPLAKKIAEEHNIDLSTIEGSGYRGKIMKIDILEAISNIDGSKGNSKSKEKIESKESIKESSFETSDSKFENLEERIPMSAMRKVISKRMSESFFTAPTFTLNYEVDMSEMIALRKKLIDPIVEKTGNKVTFTDLISMAVIKNLMKKQHKFINASLSEDGKEIIIHNYVNLALAVGLDEGLLTPVVKNADKMSISELVVAFKTMAKKAQDMKLKPDELSGSTFTISNLGMFGVNSFNPIINQPNSAILGISSTKQVPSVVDSEIVIRPIMQISLTIDHRVIDGMAGAKFMQDLKKTIENPMELFI